MILKIIKTTHNFCLISILIFCFSQNRALSASKEPIISVLILKDKKIRIRSDRSIPLTINGQRFSNKKIKGLTLKKQNAIKQFLNNCYEIYQDSGYIDEEDFNDCAEQILSLWNKKVS